MSKSMRLALGIICSITLFAQSTYAATVQKLNIEGSSVFIGFTVDQTITCADGSTGSVFASGFLTGAESVTTISGSPQISGNATIVELDSYSNSCTGTVFGGFGAAPGGFQAPDNRLTSAALRGTASVQDFSTGDTLLVGVDVAVTGTGDLTSSHSTSTQRTMSGKGGPTAIVVNRGSNSNRTGTATGTLTIEGFTLTPTFYFVQLISNTSSQILIER